MQRSHRPLAHGLCWQVEDPLQHACALVEVAVSAPSEVVLEVWNDGGEELLAARPRNHAPGARLDSDGRARTGIVGGRGRLGEMKAAL